MAVFQLRSLAIFVNRLEVLAYIKLTDICDWE